LFESESILDSSPPQFVTVGGGAGHYTPAPDKKMNNAKHSIE